MYGWLGEELARIRWRGFHKVDPTAAARLADSRLPPSYLEFVRCFGAARLYRRRDMAQVGVRCPPERVIVQGTAVLCVGHFWFDGAHFIEADLVPGKECPVLELFQGELDPVADSFGEWLELRCASAREKYGPAEWAKLEAGAPAFTDLERAIVAARKRFASKYLGPDDSGRLRIQVRNGSDRTLPALTIGVKSKRGTIRGLMSLDVSTVAPDEERVVVVKGYDTLPPEDVELVDPGDPQPEDRELFVELSAARGAPGNGMSS